MFITWKRNARVYYIANKHILYTKPYKNIEYVLVFTIQLPLTKNSGEAFDKCDKMQCFW